MKLKKLIPILILFTILLDNFLSMSGNIQKDNRIKFMEILHGGNVLTNKKIINIPFTIKGPHIILIKAKINKNKKRINIYAKKIKQ